MQALFSPDSKFMQILSRIADLILLNILFLLTSLPIITVGAASTALYTVCFQMIEDRESSIVKAYFQAFRENFKQATILWLILALCIASSAVNLLLFYYTESVLRYICPIFAILLILAVLTFGYAFPLVSRFSNDTRSTLKNAIFLSIGHLPRSLFISLLNVFPLALFLLNLYVFFKTGILWIILYFAAAAYVNALLLNKVFAPYLTAEEVSP